MALSRVTTWSAGQTLTASALNAEFDNIINGAASLINGVAGSFTTVVASGNSTMTQLTLSGALIKSVTNTITAGSTQTQAGATALTKDINRVTVSDTNGDGVALPAAVVGAKIEIINDDAAQTIQIWPASGDSIDGGSANAVDANTLAAGGDRTYFSVDSTNWYTKSSDEPAASATVSGVVELATDAETITGTDTARAVTPANIQAKVAGLTVKGIVELATTVETTDGADAARVVTPEGLHDMTSLSGAAWMLDENNLATDSDVKVASQQSIKAYVDALGVTSSGSPTFTGLTTTGHTQRSLETGITAGTTQTMAGATALTKDINIVTVNGNDDDGVALPTAVAGKEVTIINSDAAQRLQVWPGNGFSDTIDGGSANAVDANKLAAGASRVYAADGATNWVTKKLGLNTPVGVASGGTGATSLTSGGVLLGSGTDPVTAMAVLTDGQMIVGDGTTDPVAESGTTLRNSIGLGTGDAVGFTSVALGGGDALAYYVEGTFTPVIVFASGSGTIVYVRQNGWYTRIGNQVFLTVELATSDIASRTGVVSMSGFPISSSSAPSLVSGGGSWQYWAGLALTSGVGPRLLMEDGATTAQVYVDDGTANPSEMAYSEWTDNGRCDFKFSYFV